MVNRRHRSRAAVRPPGGRTVSTFHRHPARHAFAVEPAGVLSARSSCARRSGAHRHVHDAEPSRKSMPAREIVCSRGMVKSMPAWEIVCSRSIAMSAAPEAHPAANRRPAAGLPATSATTIRRRGRHELDARPPAHSRSRTSRAGLELRGTVDSAASNCARCSAVSPAAYSSTPARRALSS